MAVNKDSSEVVEFMTVFARLRDWLDDEPEGLYELAIDGEDAPLKELCSKVYWAAFFITRSNKSRRELFASPVDPNVIEIWKIYENRYEETVGKIVFVELHNALLDLPGQLQNDDGPIPTPLEIAWSNADWEAGERVNELQVALEFVSEELDNDCSMRDEDYTARIQESLEVWKTLRFETGLDFRGIFRRRELIPFTLIPRHVANKEVDKNKLTLIDLLQQAQEAFIFGTPYAALALMRAVLETVLRDHYLVKGRDLCERINNCKGLPEKVNHQALHRLRKRGNQVVHKRDSGLMKEFVAFEIQGQELEVMALLNQLRHLIENAPNRRN